MTIPVFLDRRSGIDRRVLANEPHDERRVAVVDRRAPGTDRYLLIVGDRGFDGFTLLIALPGLALAGAMVLSTLF